MRIALTNTVNTEHCDHEHHHHRHVCDHPGPCLWLCLSCPHTLLLPLLLAGLHGGEDEDQAEGGLPGHVQRHRATLQLLPGNKYGEHYQIFKPVFKRAHQNTLEKMPLFLILLLAAGVFNAKVATALGLFWIVSRVIYSVGYYSGMPKNRVVGSLVGHL